MPNGPLKVLVADDDPAIRRLLYHLLRARGYRVTLAPDGQAALDAALADCPDILITDWNMPILDGEQLCRQIRAASLPHYVYIVMLTAQSQSADLVRGLDAGADEFLAKPVQSGELFARFQAGVRVVQLEKNLRLLSERDPLTGALNRRTFLAQCEREWSRAQRYAQPLSCVLLDIDFFKKINDQFGHPAGDAALVATARLLASQSRPCDYVCRYGGEEFLALLPQTDEAGARQWADRIRLALESPSLDYHGKALSFTASFGVASNTADALSVEQIVDRADQALLVAKRSGRNRVVAFSGLQDDTLDPTSLSQSNNPLAGVAARDIMSTLVLCLREQDTIAQAAALLLDLRIGSVPVVDDQGNLAGIVSERDLMTATVRDSQWNVAIREVMNAHVVAYEETAPAQEIFDFLSRVSLRRVVVVNDGRPVGVISRDGFLRWFCNWERCHRSASPSAPQGVPSAHSDLVRTAAALARQGDALSRNLASGVDDVVPLVVGEVTRMQDLINDLLGQCPSPMPRSLDVAKYRPDTAAIADSPPTR